MPFLSWSDLTFRDLADLVSSITFRILSPRHTRGARFSTSEHGDSLSSQIVYPSIHPSISLQIFPLLLPLLPTRTHNMLDISCPSILLIISALCEKYLKGQKRVKHSLFPFNSVYARFVCLKKLLKIRRKKMKAQFPFVCVLFFPCFPFGDNKLISRTPWRCLKRWVPDTLSCLHQLWAPQPYPMAHN